MLTSLSYPLKTDEVIITKIFFINCLPNEDVGVFNRCYEDITTNILDKTIYKDYYERIDCQSAAQFLNALDKIYEEVNRYRLCHAVRTENIMQAVLPFIQIEAHGSEETIQMANGETVTGEIFYEKLLKINIASENNTILLSNTCYSISHILNIKGYKKTREKGFTHTTPVYAAIGPENIILSQNIENNLSQLFQGLLINKATTNPINTYAKNLNMKIYFCEFHWKRLIKSKISKYYPYNKHKETRLTDFTTNTPILNILSLTQVRKALKKLHSKELQFVFNSTEEEFLIGKKSIYTLEDILKELDEENKK